MSLDNTIEELIQQVRDLTDEDNSADISDSVIIRMLNRSQQEMVRILSRHYNSYFKKEVLYGNSDFVNDVDSQARVLKMNNQTFGFAINSVDAKSGTSWFPVAQVPFNYTLGMDNSVSNSSLPLTYAVQGNKLFLYPAVSSSTSIRVRYQYRAPKLVTRQGRITTIDVDNDLLTLDTLGTGLTTEIDSLGAFVNIIDHLTGEIKCTLQVSGINTSLKRLTTKSSSLDRSTVFGYTVSSEIPATVTQDDLVCLADGTCIPTFGHDLTNFLVDIAGFYVKRKLGIVDSADFEERNAITKALSGMQFGREETKKINRTRNSGPLSYQGLFRGK